MVQIKDGELEQGGNRRQNQFNDQKMICLVGEGIKDIAKSGLLRPADGERQLCQPHIQHVHQYGNHERHQQLAQKQRQAGRRAEQRGGDGFSDGGNQHDEYQESDKKTVFALEGASGHAF